MKTKLIALIFSLTLLIAAGQLGAQPASETAPPETSALTEAFPRAELDLTTFNAGDIKAGSTVMHDFLVKNTGNAELAITSVVPGCGCSVANFDKTIAPGATGKVTISVEVYSEWAGQKLRKSALMTTNDPQNNNVRLIIEGNILPNAPTQDGKPSPSVAD